MVGKIIFWLGLFLILLGAGPMIILYVTQVILHLGTHGDSSSIGMLCTLLFFFVLPAGLGLALVGWLIRSLS